ncbi:MULTISPECIES: TlpA family protein disulfide reductase [Olivibacter]|uniref:TlpA family protein disulfide reductase n=1 Tax=Olivibacter oleidegradans TaxID=760123 RepID=A0ABV6HIX9_9SPHI|nr:TlpA disulfide reductase family protein [Olivibacter jilunii]
MVTKSKNSTFLLIIKHSVVIILLLASIKSFGQNELKIGDQVPDLEINNIINQSKNKLQLKDLYKNGLLIINFWATWCAPCLKELTLLDSIKKKQPQKFNVLSVSYEKSQSISTFLSSKRNQDIKTSSLNVETDDTLLTKYFPHKFLPHNIWIDSLGIVRAITGGKDITEANVLNFYNESRNLAANIKKDNMTFNPLETFHLGDSLFKYRSIITPRFNGINGGMSVRSSGGLTDRFFQYNGTITQLYWAAYSFFNPRIKHNLIKVQTQDSLKFYWPVGKNKHLLAGSKYDDKDEWAKENTFCYELSLDQPVPDSVFRNYMFNDLERFFKISVSFDMTKIPCWVVSMDKKNNKLLSTASSNEAMISFSASKMIVQNSTLEELLKFLSMNFQKLDEPFINETADACQTRLNFVLDFSSDTDFAEKKIFTLEAVFKKLRRLGLSFRKEMRTYPILVLKDT